MTVKVRIAPSPTGAMHIGTARTALFNWLFARKHGGQFILRIEDTDLERSDKKYEDDIISGLRWLGLDWDNTELYRQSERLPLYKQYLKALLDSGKAFWCHHTKGELEAEQKKQMAHKEPPRHLCGDKNSERGAKKGELVRLAVDKNSSRMIVFQDNIRGAISWEERLLGDISVAKDPDTPLYNFAVVVDDVDMGITHVIRGEDHVSNTPKQILIYEALGKPIPEFAHLPMILGTDKTKLSKRHGATSVIEYKKDYLPEALVNFIGFLGFTFSREILGKEEMAQEFELQKVHKSGAVFNIEKLNWINAQYVKRLDAKTFKDTIGKKKLPDAAVPLMTERLEKLSDAEEYSYFWREPEYDAELLRWKDATPEQLSEALSAIKEMLAVTDVTDRDEVRRQLDALGAARKNRGLAYWPLRVALTGKKTSPDPVDIAFVLGRDEVLKRVDAGLKKLSRL